MKSTGNDEINNSKNVYVAFLDILGFSNLVDNNDHSVVEQLYDNLFTVFLQASVAHVAEANLSGQFWKYVNLDNGQQVAVPKLENAKINLITMSDSVLLWTTGDSIKDFVDLIATVRNFLVTTMANGLPLRGAITYGEISVCGGFVQAGSSIIQYRVVGKPLVHAARLEKELRWSGCIIDEVTIRKFRNDVSSFKALNAYADQGIDLDYLVEKKLLGQYDTPLKGAANTKKMYVVNWVSARPVSFTENEVRVAFSRHKKIINDTEKDIVENTVAFFNHQIM